MLEQKRFQLIKNLSLKIGDFGINVLIAIFLTPYLIKELGSDGYSLIPVVLVFMESISVITMSLKGSINRFLTIHLYREEWESGNRVFNTALFGLAGLFVVLLVPFSLISFFPEILINIPKGLLNETKYLFFFTFLGFGFQVISGVFRSILFVYNRIDLDTNIEIVYRISRVFLIIVFFTFYGASLKYVGLAYFLSSIVAFLLVLTFWNGFKINLRVRFKEFNLDEAKKLFNMGGWLSLGRIGTLLLVSMDIYMLNIFFDLNISGTYGAISQLLNVIRVGVGLVSSILVPVIMIQYSKQLFFEMLQTVKTSIKLILYGMSVAICVLLVFGKEILVIWLGVDFGQYSTLFNLMTISLLLSLPINILFSLFTAYNKVKFPGKLQLFFGIGHIILSVLLIKFTSLSYYSIPASGIAIVFFKNIIVLPIYASKNIELTKSDIFRPMLKGFSFFLFLLICFWICSRVFSITSFFEIITITIIFIIIQFLLLKFLDKNFFYQVKFLFS